MARWAGELWDQASGRATDHCCERRWNRYFAVVGHGAERKCDGWDDSQDDKNLTVIPLIACIENSLLGTGVYKVVRMDKKTITLETIKRKTTQWFLKQRIRREHNTSINNIPIKGFSNIFIIDTDFIKKFKKFRGK